MRRRMTKTRSLRKIEEKEEDEDEQTGDQDYDGDKGRRRCPSLMQIIIC